MDFSWTTARFFSRKHIIEVFGIFFSGPVLDYY